MRRIMTFFSSSEIAANHTADRVEDVFATLTVFETLKAMTIIATCMTVFPLALLVLSVSDASA